MEVKIDDVKVGKRIRHDFGDISGLGVSIQKYGLINPICVDKNNNLVAGERRLRAAKGLGWKKITITRFEDLSNTMKREIELEENIQRKALTWQEEIAAKLALHELKQSIAGKRTQKSGGPGHGIKDTALMLDESAGTISMDLQLAKAIKAFPSLAKEQNKTTAFKKYKRMQEGFFRAEINRRRSDNVVPNVIHGDCTIEMKKMKDESYDMILTDPPFGVNVQQSAGLGKRGKEIVAYDDNVYNVMELIRRASKECYRLLKNDRHMIMFFAMANYSAVKKSLEDAGFDVEPTPLIWNKTSGSAAATGTFFPMAYEPAFWCKKGRRNLNTTVCNMFTCTRVPPAKKSHPTEKPIPLLVALMEACTFTGESILDPFAGGGSTLEAAMETGRECPVVDKNEMYYMRILDKVEDIKGRKVKEE